MKSKNALSFTAITLMVAFVIAGFWTGFIGSEGMKCTFTCFLCAMLLGVAYRKSISSSPWAFTTGLLFSGYLLGVPAKLMPSGNLGYGHLAHASGVTVSEATHILNVAIYCTLLICLAHFVLDWLQARPAVVKSTVPPTASKA